MWARGSTVPILTIFGTKTLYYQEKMFPEFRKHNC